MTTIFKIKSTSDYYATSRDELSFRKGQAFYALSLNAQGFYMVSTQYSTPFARNAVCGSVPSHLFTVTDDFKAKASKKVAPAPAQKAAPLTPSDDKDPGSGGIIMGTLVSKTSVSSFNKTTYMFNIRIITKAGAKTISRTYADVLQFHAGLEVELAGHSILKKLPALPEESNDFKQLYRVVYNYISVLFQSSSRQTLDSAASLKFFNSTPSTKLPKESNEGSVTRSKASAKLLNILGRYK